MSTTKKGSGTPDDAWASLDESDDWRERSEIDRGAPERAGRTATNMRIRPEDKSSMRATKGPHLVVVAGAEVGRIYPLGERTMTVGRGEKNDVVLADGSVSREHARLELTRGRWFVHDLDSGNGTFIQAKRVRSGELVPGEQVAFGHVRMQLREARMQAPSAQADKLSAGPPAEVGRRGPNERTYTSAADQDRPPARAEGSRAKLVAGASSLMASGFTGLRSLAVLNPLAPKAQRSVWARVVAGCLVALFLGGWVAVFLDGRSSAENVFRLCQRGAKAFAARSYDDAEQAISQARALMPQHPRVLLWGRAIRRARGDEERLAVAHEALSAGNLELARSALGQLAGSPLYEKVEALETELDRAEKALLVEAQTAFGAGLQQEGATLLARFGSARLAPSVAAKEEYAGPAERPDVAALQRWRGAQQASASLLAPLERWRQRPHKKPSLWEQASGQSPALRAALRAFRGARAERAARASLRALGHPAGPKETQVAGAMQRFATLWDTGIEEHRGKRAFAAIRVLTDAKSLALAVGGEGCVPLQDINAKLADMYYVVGMQSFVAQKLPEAAEALRVALTLSPDHALSLRRMEEIEDRAVRMVDQAEFIRKGHPARAKELLHQVSAALPGGSETGQRARRLLAEVAP